MLSQHISFYQPSVAKCYVSLNFSWPGLTFGSLLSTNVSRWLAMMICLPSIQSWRLWRRRSRSSQRLRRGLRSVPRPRHRRTTSVSVQQRYTTISSVLVQQSDKSKIIIRFINQNIQIYVFLTLHYRNRL